MTLPDHPLEAVRPLLNERCENWLLLARVDGRLTMAWHMEEIDRSSAESQASDELDVTWLRDAVTDVMTDGGFNEASTILLAVIAHGVIDAAVKDSDVGDSA